MVIKNVRIYTEEKKFCPGSIEVRDTRIAAVRYEKADIGAWQKPQALERHGIANNNAAGILIEKDGSVVDGRGCYALPGMIDMHLHGCKGWDICDFPDRNVCVTPDRETLESRAAKRKSEEEIKEETADVYHMWQEIADYQVSVGVTGMAPATMTLPAEQLKKTLQYAAGFAKRQRTGKAGGARLAGINMEGPFISPARCGAQDASYIVPCSEKLMAQFLEAGEGLVKVVGIAPEKEGALAMIRRMKDQVRVSLAHTDADYETARKALEAGACHVTHIFNAMPPWHHRLPGVAGAAFDAAAEGKPLMAELICDGFHVHPSMIRTAFHLLGDDRIVLISDSMRASGMPAGEYTLGGQDVVVRELQGKGSIAVLKKNDSLAGSVVSLPDCVRTTVREAGISLEQAVAAATINPAKCLGIEKEQGSISVGKRADILLWDQNLVNRMVICDGKIW